MWNENDLAYFAGLMDGEGTFTVVVQRRGKHGYFMLHPFASFTITDRALTEWAFHKWGGQLNKYTPKQNRKDAYKWRLTKHGALSNLLPLLIPHLKLKKRQAELLLEFVKHRQEQGNKHYHMEMDFKTYRLAKDIRQLNGNNDVGWLAEAIEARKTAWAV